MKLEWKRAVVYLTLNALVSACVAWAVLTWWGKRYLPPPPPTLAVAQPAVTPLPPTPTPPRFVYTVRPGDTLSAIAARYGVSVAQICALNGIQPDTSLAVGQGLLIPGQAPTPTPMTVHQGDIEITEVLGAGILEDERVLITYHGEGRLNLQGWRLDDGRGQVYTFPALWLEHGGAVQVWTKGGMNDTVVDLYWGRDHAVWPPGATVTLRDPQGKVMAQYTVP